MKRVNLSRTVPVAVAIAIIGTLTATTAAAFVPQPQSAAPGAEVVGAVREPARGTAKAGSPS